MSAPTVFFVCDQLVIGGAQRLIARICAACKTAGWRVELLAAPAPPTVGDDARPWFAGTVDRITALEVSAVPQRLALLTRPDVAAVCYSHPSASAAISLRVAALRRDIRQSVLLYNHFDVARFRPLAPGMDLAVAESSEVLSHVSGDGGGGDGARLIPSFVPPLPVRPERDPALPLHVGFIGRLDRLKNPMSVPAMAWALPRGRFRFSMVGDGRLADRLKRWVRLVGMVRDVRYLGPVSDEELGRLWSDLDVIVVPSLAEGRPLVVQEARWRGVAIVASRVGGIPDIVTHDETGLLCEAGGVRDFTAQLWRLATEPGLLGRIASAARRSAEQEEAGASRLDRYVAAITGSDR